MSIPQAKPPTCNLQLFIDGAQLPITKARFPAGESMIRIPPWDSVITVIDEKNPQSPLIPSTVKDITIRMDFRDNGDFIDLLLLIDAINREYTSVVIRDAKRNLILDYLPYARQDRVTVPGESLSIKVITDLINGARFDNVYCKDIHSDVGISLLNNLNHLNLSMAAGKVIEIHGNQTVIVAPDAGASRKVGDFARKHACRQILQAHKKRDPVTGIISGTWVDTYSAFDSAHLGQRNLLVLDDICDGGATFLALGQELKKVTTGQLFLYVTHGIFSKGLDALLEIYDVIYVSNNMSGIVDDRLIVV